MAKTKRRRSPSKPRPPEAAARKARPARKGVSRTATAAQVRALLDEMSAASMESAGDSARGGGLAAAVAPEASAAGEKKAVTFTCSNLQCLVGITVGSTNVVFAGTGGSLFSTGAFIAHWRVKGSGAFKITATGATLSPISSTAPDAGLANFVVTP